MTSTIQNHQITELVSNVLNKPVNNVELIGTGASSTAWRVHSDSVNLIFRNMRPNSNRPTTYRSEFRLLHHLDDKNLPVPHPIAISFEYHELLDENFGAWALTQAINGAAILQNQLPSQTANQTGKFLAQLHQIPCADYGRLIEDNRCFVGQQSTPTDGIRSRWCWAQLFPFDEIPLAQHPISNIAPHLIDRISKIEPILWKIGSNPNTAVIHSDLHGQHIFVSEDEDLAGIIDLGAAFIGVVGWEFAVLAFYHGWKSVQNILEGYSGDNLQINDVLYQAKHLAVVLSLYKLDKAVKSQVGQQKIKRILQFLEDVLNSL